MECNQKRHISRHRYLRNVPTHKERDTQRHRHTKRETHKDRYRHPHTHIYTHHTQTFPRALLTKVFINTNLFT